MTLIYVDLNDFEKFKLEHGEKAANQILAMLEVDFQSRFRSDDLIAHIHGEEFLILLPGVGPENAIETLHRFQRWKMPCGNAPGRSPRASAQ